MTAQSSQAEIAFVELGSNIEPGAYLPQAVARLAKLGRILNVSSAYRNPAVGPAGQPDFVNLAVRLETDLPPSELRASLRSIEVDLGRERTGDPYGPRIIDLDLSLYGGHDADLDGLLIPDPDILKRAYLARTLAQLDPHFIHPVTGQTLEEIADQLTQGPGDLVPLPDLDRDIRRVLASG